MVVHGVTPQKATSFIARIRNLTRKGLIRKNLERGRAANYTEREYRLFFFGMELTALGLPPEHAVEIVHSNLAVLNATADEGGECDVICPSFVGGRTPQSRIRLVLPKLA